MVDFTGLDHSIQRLPSVCKDCAFVLAENQKVDPRRIRSSLGPFTGLLPSWLRGSCTRAFLQTLKSRLVAGFSRTSLVCFWQTALAFNSCAQRVGANRGWLRGFALPSFRRGVPLGLKMGAEDTDVHPGCPALKCPVTHFDPAVQRKGGPWRRTFRVDHQKIQPRMRICCCPICSAVRSSSGYSL